MRALSRLLLVSALSVLLVAAWARQADAAGRPDIRAVTVARDQAGSLSFLIDFSGAVTFDARTKLQVMLDTDRDSGTGIQGAEYALDYSSESRLDRPTAALLTTRNGETLRFYRSRLTFSSSWRTAMFTVPVSEIGDPARFDFWVYVQRDGEVVDNAPTHVVVSTEDAPWTYPKGDPPVAGHAYPVETYDDLSDTSLVGGGSFPWLPVVLVVAGLGAAVGLGGWAWERLHRKTPPPGRPVDAR